MFKISPFFYFRKQGSIANLAIVLSLLTSASFAQEFIAIEEELSIGPSPIHSGLSIKAANIREEAPHHDVNLYFPWWLDIDETTLGDGDIVVTGPNGYDRRGILVEFHRGLRPLPTAQKSILALESDLNAIPPLESVLVATYRFSSPSGEDQNWVANDNGIYLARLALEQIATQSGRTLPGQFLGSFLCAIRSDPGNPVQPIGVRCTVKPYRIPAESGDAALPNDLTSSVNPVGYRAIVYSYFNTPYVEVDWGTISRSGNVFTAEATAVKQPFDGLLFQPLKLPLAGTSESLESTDVQTFSVNPDRPEILPVFRHGYDLGSLPPDEYSFVIKVNGKIECSDAFIAPPTHPIDIEAPQPKLRVGDIKKPSTEPHRLLVTYKDRSGVDVSTISDSDLVVFGPRVFADWTSADRSHWFAQRARFIEIASSTPHARLVKALYEIDAPPGGWTENRNGNYTVILWEDAVCDRIGNCVERQTIGQFEVSINEKTRPVPAEAEIKVDVSNPNRVIAKVHIDFKEHWLVVDQKIRREGNRIYCVATAEPQATILIFPPPPPPQQDLLYEIGPLETGEYGVVFIMNGHVYDAERIAVHREPPIPARVELIIDTSNADAVIAEVTIQFQQAHRVEQGDIEVQGHRVIFSAKAEPLPIPLDAQTSAIQPLPEPIQLRYEISDLGPGGYLGAFVMNDHVYAVEPFKIEPAEPPIPAEVVLRVDQNDPDNTVIWAKIVFETPHAIVAKHIHRRDQSFVLEVKATPIATLADNDKFAPIPLPQVVWLRFPLGEIEPGEHKAAFVMNGWPYTNTTWNEPEDRLKAEVSIDVEKLDTGAWQARVKVLFKNPWVTIVDPGEAIFDGHIIRINATAEAPDEHPAVVIEPEPIELVYNLGLLEPGGYWLKYFINGYFEKQHDFIVDPEAPIPAKVDLKVDTGNQPVIATATIQFRDHYRIVDQETHRRGNLFLLDATAEGPLPILAPIPPPPTEVDYHLGELPQGHYFAAFRMNGFVYDFIPFRIGENGDFKAEVKLKVDIGEAVKLTAVVDIDDPYVIVTNPGEPKIDGNLVQIFATAERVTFIVPPSGDPMTFEYDLGALDPDKYRIIYYINGSPEASLGFIVPGIPKPPLARISHIKIAQGDASWFANVGVILLPGQEVTDWGLIRQSDNTFHVDITVEYVDFAPSPEPIPLLDAALLPDGIIRGEDGTERIGHLPIRIVAHDYVLGVLDPGEYGFAVHSRGKIVAKKSFNVDGSAPGVDLEISNLFEPTETHSFRISYSDTDGLDHESIMNSPVWIANGSGRIIEAELIDYASTDDFPSTQGLGQYDVTGPGGSWDARDNGRYCIFVEPEAIRDLNGNHIRRSRIGCFKARIAPKPPQTGVNVSVDVNDQGEWEATVEILSEPGEQVIVDSWETLIHHGHSIVALANVHVDAHGGPVEPLAHVYNLGMLQPGYYIFVFKTNFAHCGAVSFHVPGVEGDPFDNWLHRVGVLDHENADRDGLNALGEYFFATDPTKQDVAYMRPEIVVNPDGEQCLGFRYRRIQGAEGILQIIEGSNDMDAWNDISAEVEIVEQSVLLDGTEEILICFPQSIQDSPYNFLRLRLIRDFE